MSMLPWKRCRSRGSLQFRPSHHDLGGFEVAVKHMLGMGVIEPLASLAAMSCRSQIENPSLRASMVATLLPCTYSMAAHS